jgi:NDP-sugar pyrophosphorylase family protein
MHLTLVVLAAGMGSRYGGLKQLDAVGPAGETLLDYAVFDAARAGFGRVLFVIRRDFEDVFRRQIGSRYEGRMVVDYAFQSLDALPDGRTPPPGRVKPWGTGHAVWCAREALHGGFAVINADDFYGRESFQRLGDFLRREPTPDNGRATFAMVGFRLANTLSEHGAVSRGLCSVGNGGRLLAVVERTGIRPEDVGPGAGLSGDESVSMNCWAFDPRLFPGLDRRFRTFLAERGTEPTAEFYLPAAVSDLIAAGEATVEVLPTQANWFGVTYREDKPRVAAALRALVDAGEYPASVL